MESMRNGHTSMSSCMSCMVMQKSLEEKNSSTWYPEPPSSCLTSHFCSFHVCVLELCKTNHHCGKPKRKACLIRSSCLRGVEKGPRSVQYVSHVQSVRSRGYLGREVRFSGHLHEMGAHASF
jgi:hypothetical protein